MNLRVVAVCVQVEEHYFSVALAILRVEEKCFKRVAAFFLAEEMNPKVVAICLRVDEHYFSGVLAIP